MNSTTAQFAWNAIVQAIRKLARKKYWVAKHVKNNENILRPTVIFKKPRYVFQALTDKKYLEITYAKVANLSNAQHLTMYEKT